MAAVEFDFSLGVPPVVSEAPKETFPTLPGNRVWAQGGAPVERFATLHELFKKFSQSLPVLLNQRRSAEQTASVVR
jgi:hypothetical protein